MRVLGVDPGLTRCGLGVVDSGSGGRASYVFGTTVRTPATDELPLRLLAIETAITAAIEEHRPDVVAVERVFSQHNVRTVMGTAQAGAVAVLCAARAGLPVGLHTPSEVKAALTGSGRADKAQMGRMVTRLLSPPAGLRLADEADALALALCHLWRGSASTKLARLAAAARQASA